MKVWIDDPMPLSFYTSKEKEVQKLINEKTTDGIITYSPLSAEKEWTSVDFEEITPYTWKWIDFELPKPDGTLTKIALRRPHWWLREIGADSVGKQVYLNMPELGSQGWATVKAIRVNQLDTRFWDENRKGDFVSRPITGKFEHESNDVYYLHFGDNPNPLGVTGSHPIWSIDRNDWVGASELRIGEKVKTQEGLTVLKSRTKSDKRQKVYNLEIYKDHNFLVSTDKILVHNSCVTDVLGGLTTGKINTKHIQDHFYVGNLYTGAKSRSQTFMQGLTQADVIREATDILQNHPSKILSQGTSSNGHLEVVLDFGRTINDNSSKPISQVRIWFDKASNTITSIHPRE
ncbi:MAG: hypothetical protein HC880_08405 [Bacteroidia bacterium]|nr:hypothetical protein [Bacteroidia bacterium]